MNVRQLKKILEQFDEEASVCVWFKWKGESVVDEAVSIGNNNGSVQINCWTCFEGDFYPKSDE